MDAPPSQAGAPPPGLLARLAARLPRTYLIVREVIACTLRDGYVHAGNFAYLCLVTLLPLAILITAVAVSLGQTDAGQQAIAAVLRALPANVAQLFQPVIDEVLEARTGHLLLLGGVVALWTVSTFLETLKDLLRRAFGQPDRHGFIGNRLRSIGGTLLAMLLVIVMIVAQVALLVVLKALRFFFPGHLEIPGWIDWSRAVTPAFVFLALWALFKLLTPRDVRHHAAWPGALVTTVAWVGGSFLLGPAFSSIGQMNLTYGALSGVMLALLFFYAVGFALVFGAELNAGLARHRNRH